MNMFNNALLKECRKNKGLTQYDASKIIGVARTTYADYENGKIQPPIDKIHRICEWLDLPLEKIYQTLQPNEKRYIWQSIIDYIEVGTNRDDITIHFR